MHRYLLANSERKVGHHQYLSLLSLRQCNNNKTARTYPEGRRPEEEKTCPSVLPCTACLPLFCICTYVFCTFCATTYTYAFCICIALYCSVLLTASIPRPLCCLPSPVYIYCSPLQILASTCVSISTSIATFIIKFLKSCCLSYAMCMRDRREGGDEVVSFWSAGRRYVPLPALRMAASRCWRFQSSCGGAVVRAHGPRGPW